MTPFIVTMGDALPAVQLAAPVALQSVSVIMPGVSPGIVVDMAWVNDALEIWVTDDGFVWAGVA